MTGRNTVLSPGKERLFPVLSKKAKYIGLLFVCGMLSGCAESYPMGKASASAAAFEEVSDEHNKCTRECNIELGSEVSVSGSGAWLSGREIVIQKGGVYIFTGITDDCSINVDTSDPVKLVFNSSEISNESGYAVYSSSDKLIVESIGFSRLCGSGASAALYSNGRTLFVGEGSLSVEGGVYSETPIEFGKNTAAQFDDDDEEENSISGTLIVNGKQYEEE